MNDKDQPGVAQKQEKLKYRRVLLKLSGEVLRNRENGECICPNVVAAMSAQVKRVAALGCQIAIVLGGGNIFRGAIGEACGIDRNSGDYMGMLSTIINGLALQNGLEKAGLPTRLQTAIEMPQVAEPFILRRALRHLEKGRVVIFAGGTGNPYFSTDTAAALRASEIGANVLLKATKVDGVYTADPKRDPAAKRYTRLSYHDALRKRLKVMDSAAFALCMENSIPIVVFDFFDDDACERVVTGEAVGTLVADFPDEEEQT
ncbi:MAG: UMP kinase [Kiritimatiellae bacterium]|nr:UMP kinase [Kiritimatiellia bacterium]